jgi:hypothetical protein
VTLLVDRAPESDWLTRLIQSFADERRRWEERPELTDYLARALLLRTKMMKLISGAYAQAPDRFRNRSLTLGRIVRFPIGICRAWLARTASLHSRFRRQSAGVLKAAENGVSPSDISGFRAAPDHSHGSAIVRSPSVCFPTLIPISRPGAVPRKNDAGCRSSRGLVVIPLLGAMASDSGLARWTLEQALPSGAWSGASVP